MRIVYVSKLDGFFKTRIQKEKKNNFAKSICKEKRISRKNSLDIFLNNALFAI